mmetsp:Transcript_30159/g.62130  ORF Transcript_30159/g.62130 Transcript_30159/m.62130 type:complete len:301 (+) Transcript_30159:217-1119(+)
MSRTPANGGGGRTVDGQVKDPLDPYKYTKWLAKSVKTIKDLEELLSAETANGEEGFTKIRTISRAVRDTQEKVDLLQRELRDRYRLARELQVKRINDDVPKVDVRETPPLKAYADLQANKVREQYEKSKEELARQTDAASDSKPPPAVKPEGKPKVVKEDKTGRKEEKKRKEPPPPTSDTVQQPVTPKKPTKPAPLPNPTDFSIAKAQGKSAVEKALERAKLKEIEKSQELEKTKRLRHEDRKNKARAILGTSQVAKDFVKSVSIALEEEGDKKDEDTILDEPSVLDYLLKDSDDLEIIS